MRLKQDNKPQRTSTPTLDQEQAERIPQTIALRPESTAALEQIRQRDSYRQYEDADVAASAIEVFNVLTRHLAKKDSSVILYTVGESLQTLDIKNTAGSHGDGVRTVYKWVQLPKR